MKTDLLKIARERAGKKVLKGGIVSLIKIAGAVIIGEMILLSSLGYANLLFSIGYAKEIGVGILALPLGVLTLFIAFRIITARKNPEFVRKELEEIAHDEEMLLAKHEEDLAKDVELLHLQQEDIEICVRQQVQEEKDVALRRFEERLSVLREGLANASPKDRLASQEFFLTRQQELREIELLMEELRLDDRADLREALVEETSKNYAFSCEKIIEPRAAALRLEIAQSKQVIAEVRQFIAEL